MRAVDPLICYSVKANSNLAVLSLLAKAGSGFDVVSGGELERVRKAGARRPSAYLPEWEKRMKKLRRDFVTV